MTAPATPYVVGLTGGIGSGKSTAANAFADLGAHVIDVDQISHALTAPSGAALGAIAEAFPGVVTASVLDRARLRERVFADPAARVRLEQILHPLIHQTALRQLQSPAAAGAPYVLLVVPLLFESGRYQAQLRCAITVDLPEPMQIERVVSTRQVPESTVRRIMATQLPRERRLAQSQFVLDNLGLPADLMQQISRLHRVLSSNAVAGRRPERL